MMNTLKIKTFLLPKAGNKLEEYEDAYGYTLKDAKRLVIADGASQGFESKKWAMSLVASFIEKNPALEKGEIKDWLKTPIEKWKGEINWEILPWYAEEKARRGAFSTLLGLDLGNSSSNRWKAVAVGDSCLFQIRADKVISHFPMKSSKDFDSTPDLISTRKDYNSSSLDNIKIFSGDYKPNDLFIIATDAFSAWFLSLIESGQKPWKVFFELARVNQPKKVEHKIFRELINYLRDRGRMQNDDVTVILAEVRG
jgi:hypothetical protein